MDKYERRDNGYKYDYEDGIYEVVYITHLEKSKHEQKKFSRLIEIENGLVVFPEIRISQISFFEVNEVIDKLIE